jgi:hypothetical protein
MWPFVAALVTWGPDRVASAQSPIAADRLADCWSQCDEFDIELVSNTDT